MKNLKKNLRAGFTLVELGVVLVFGAVVVVGIAVIVLIVKIF